jgi:hypothetical protein
MLNGVNTHPDWAESLAVAIVGMLAGRKRYMFNNLGPLRANLFFIMVGASGLSFKSVPLMKVARPLLKRLSKAVNDDALADAGITEDEYNARKLANSKADAKERQKDEWKKERAKLDDIERNMVDFVIPQVFTSEMLTTILSKHPQGIICGDEYTKMFKGTQKKDYLVDNMELLSRMYDCDMEKVGTQTRGIENPEEAYVSFTSASTYYLLTIMTDDFFLQGTGNRILWILDEELYPVDLEKEGGKFFWDLNRELEFNNKMDELVVQLMNVRYLPEGIIMPNYAAGFMLDSYRIEMYNEAVEKFNKDLLNKDANLISRLAQNAMKLALAHAIGRYAEDDRGTYQDVTNLEINVDDATWAIAKTRRHFEYYKRMWEVASTIKTGTMKTYKADQERVLFILERIEGQGNKMTAAKLKKATGWDNTECQKLLDTMLSNGMIKYDKYQSKTKGIIGYYTRNDVPDEEIEESQSGKKVIV